MPLKYSSIGEQFGSGILSGLPNRILFESACRALESPDAGIQKASLAGLAYFIRRLSVFAPRELTRIANNIIVLLLPSLEDGCPVQKVASRVLEVMLVDNKKAIDTSAIRRLPPLPKIPSLRRCVSLASLF